MVLSASIRWSLGPFLHAFSETAYHALELLDPDAVHESAFAYPDYRDGGDDQLAPGQGVVFAPATAKGLMF